ILKMGYTMDELALIGKIWGMTATIVGGLAGGLLMLRIGMNRSLWVFGVLQALSTLCFALLDQMPKGNILLGSVIAFENFSAGMGTAAFVGFMGTLTNKRFTATQYALLTSLMSFPRVIAS